MKKILILGISSFSGASLAGYLSKKNFLIFGTFSKEKNKYYLPFDRKKIKMFKINLLKDDKKLALLINKIRPNIIIDHASLCMVPQSWSQPEKYFKINVDSKINLIKSLKGKKFLKKYIYISTPEIFGSKIRKVDEFSSDFSPSTPYACSKLASEYHFNQALRDHKFPVIISRFSNFYGPGQPIYRLIPKVIMSINKKKRFPLEGNGASTRNFIYSEDFCEGIFKLILKGKIGKVYHFSGKQFVKIKDVIKLICSIKKINYKKFIKISKERIGKDDAYQLSYNWTKKKLHWDAKVNLKVGIFKTIMFYEKFSRQLSKESMKFSY